MNSTPAPDASLYEIALSFDQPSLVLQISPATLKSMVSSYVNLLIQQKIPAVVWAKLPRGEVWYTELDRYRLLPDVSKTIYQFKTHRADSTEDARSNHRVVSGTDRAESENHLESDSHSETDSEPDSVSSQPPQESVTPIYLSSENYLRRDYFLVIWSTAFQGLVLAHRPRSAQIANSTANLPEANTGLSDDGRIIEESQERRQHLLAMCSLNAGLITQVLASIERATRLDRSRSSTSGEIYLSDPSELNDPVHQWQELVAKMPPQDPNVHLMGQLLGRQIQRQEELVQRNSFYRKQADLAEALQIQNVELTNAIRLKDDFLNNVGQELRTPLTTIKTALSLLNSPNIKLPQRQRYMDLIAKECDRQSSLITSLLDLVQLEKVVEQSALQPIRLVDIVPGVVSMYQPVAEEKGVKLTYTVPEDLPAVSCMANWLKQIMINLLNNGITFTPTGGQVWVRAKQQGEYIHLEFRDTGIGIAPGEIPKIFERFYRGRPASEETASGAGLGLTIVQQLLLHCGGSISVKSKQGEGATFNVLLPIHRNALDKPYQ